MTTVIVRAGNGQYDVIVAPGLLDQAGARLVGYAKTKRLVIVADRQVDAHARSLIGSLEEQDIRVDYVPIDAGEDNKNWRGLERLTDRLLELEVERGEAIVALGGGVVGDLVGFAAAILKRGCDVVQVPTTLLAQVDSSVGGKTGINTRYGKNLIGAFHHPALVLIDPNTLATLPGRELRAGYAEVVKYGLLGDRAFFSWCEVNAPLVLARDPSALEYAIAGSVAAKAAIVEQDERETGDLRALLNLGHTFGHALEAEAGYDGSLLHGEAVAAGMGIAFRFSAMLGYCPRGDAELVTAHLKRVGLPFDARSAGVEASGAALAAHMLHDKKKRDGRLAFVLARAIGDAIVVRDVQLEAVAAFLDDERAASA